MRALLLVIALLGCCVGCAKRSGDAQPAAQASASGRAPNSPALVNPRAEAIPTEQDFEEQALREITPASLEAELQRLGQEIQP